MYLLLLFTTKKEKKNVQLLKVRRKHHNGGSRIFERGVADMTEQYQNNLRQSGLRDSFAHFLNFKLK